jgi:response regulator NasT
MKRSLRIAVADDEKDTREFFETIVPHLGHEVVCSAANGRTLVEKSLELSPDLVITDVKMPDMDGIDAAAEIHRAQLVPVILVSAHADPALVERAAAHHVLAYLVKPIKKEDLEVAITIAMSRFDEFQALRKEATDLRQAIEDRKLVERAKGIVMKRTGLDEEAAFRRLQKLSRDQSRKLVEIARGILTAEEALKPADEK